MTIKYTSVTNPTWNREHNAIDCIVVFEHLNNEAVPFHATPWDTMPHGVEIYNRCLAGDFGPVGDYVLTEAEKPAPVPQGQTTGTQTL
jgi:hypothetical protein